jgi:ZIP family zinc transporter
MQTIREVSMENLHPIVLALMGTGFTFLMTSLGAAMVFAFKKDLNDNIQHIFLGFAAGVMIAASVWSLLIPAIEQSSSWGTFSFIPAAGGFILGALFLFGLDNLLPHLHLGSDAPEGVPSKMQRTSLLFFAVTLHNIPEGMAVGLAFALAANQDAASAPTMAAAIALAIGIGIQNFPEGAAISLPLRHEGFTSKKAFGYGCFSGVVEPIAGVLTVLIAGAVVSAMPWLLSFAAGAMIYVTVEELIPEANTGTHSNFGTLGVLVGFVIMMILDVALG